MSRPNLKLATGEPPPRSPEREQLAEAIARRDTASKQLVRVQAAHERASNTIYDLKDSVDKAIAALDAAKVGEESYLAAVALGEADASLSPVKTAVANVEQANDLLDTARRTRDALEAEIKAAEREIMFADMALDKCVGDVARADPAIRKLAAEYAAARRRAVDLQSAMEAVQSYLPDDLQFWHGSIPAAELVGVAAWKAVLQTLRTDADAPLPS
jgi:chromosome segregation ATPase